MMRNPGRAATLIAVALAVTACGTGSYSTGSPGGGAYGSQATPATPASTSGASVRTGVLKTETIGAGQVLASGGGLTLYYYTEDKPGSGKSVCTGGCAAAWPPLAAPVRAPAGVRMPGPLGMITRPGGGAQVTINGYPIYTFSGDKSPGQDAGNGIEGAWHIIKIHARAAARVAALKTETTRAGQVLASSRGLTLYYYTEDKPGSGKSVCTGTCAAAWPPLAAPVKAPAGVRLPGPLSYISRPGGVRQLTINGYPIYTYAGDKSPGQATGNGIEGAWHIIKIR
jgi:predicted lipoprotein with Yx(FWY)xxD motif